MKRFELNFENRTVLITGAATGIGRATALAFAAAGAAVVIGDVDQRAESAAVDIVAAGGRAVFQKTDVTNSAQVKALVDRAVSEFGSLDVAFNNAGLLPRLLRIQELKKPERFTIEQRLNFSAKHFAVPSALEKALPATSDARTAVQS